MLFFVSVFESIYVVKLYPYIVEIQSFFSSVIFPCLPGHMDKYLLWHQLLLVQQLNCVCNITAKGAVQRAITTRYMSTPTRILPQEDIAIVTWENKITSDVSHPVRSHASKEIAQGLLSNMKKWPQDCFKEVDWDHLYLAMESESNVYKMWRSKQHTGFFGTRAQVGITQGQTVLIKNVLTADAGKQQNICSFALI